MPSDCQVSVRATNKVSFVQEVVNRLLNTWSPTGSTPSTSEQTCRHLTANRVYPINQWTDVSTLNLQQGIYPISQVAAPPEVGSVSATCHSTDSRKTKRLLCFASDKVSVVDSLLACCFVFCFVQINLLKHKLLVLSPYRNYSGVWKWPRRTGPQSFILDSSSSVWELPSWIIRPGLLNQKLLCGLNVNDLKLPQRSYVCEETKSYFCLFKIKILFIS